ncbi:MAG: hypothetical protein MUF06_07350 [Pirellulaceae bacterium]|jgi:hypothetical protein|nr:hypothetical protein [Pirellulaceae bacterium]
MLVQFGTLRPRMWEWILGRQPWSTPWQAELNLRRLKVELQMDRLRCQTPHRVRNAFCIHLMA